MSKDPKLARHEATNHLISLDPTSTALAASLLLDCLVAGSEGHRLDIFPRRLALLEGGCGLVNADGHGPAELASFIRGPIWSAINFGLRLTSPYSPGGREEDTDDRHTIPFDWRVLQVSEESSS